MKSGTLLEIVFPGRCALCGEWLVPGGAPRSPVCAACVEALPGFAATRCAICGTSLVSEIGTCTRCRSADFAFSASTPLFPYRGTARTLLHAFKFEGRSRCAGFYAELVAAAMTDASLPVVPVPSRSGRGGAGAVMSVASRLGRSHGRTILPVLVRTGGVPQKTLDLATRRANLLGRIQLAKAGIRVPSEVILLDDVFTTGATLDACARVLRDAGASVVRCVTLVIEE